MPSLAPMIRRVSPAVVSIGTRGTVREQGRNPLLDDPFFRRFFNAPPDGGVRERPFQSAGSGVIADAAKGYIITNAHVVENAREITVTLLDERELTARLVGSDPRTDIAIIQIEAAGLTQVTIGDSDRLEPGALVLISHALGEAREEDLRLLWERVREVQGLILVEPGTHEGKCDRS